MKILVAEGNRTVREAAVEYLRRDGHAVLEITRGYEAIDMAEHHRPDVVMIAALFIDLHGFEVARLIRAIGCGYEPRILLVTANPNSDLSNSETKLRYGIDRFLAMPITYAGVREAISGADEAQAAGVDERSGTMGMPPYRNI